VKKSIIARKPLSETVTLESRWPTRQPHVFPALGNVLTISRNKKRDVTVCDYRNARLSDLSSILISQVHYISDLYGILVLMTYENHVLKKKTQNCSDHVLYPIFMHCQVSHLFS